MAIKKGLVGVPTGTDFEGGSNLFFKPKPGETVDVMCLIGPEDFTSCLMHEHWDRMRENPPKQVIFTVCLETPDCPGCLLGNKPQPRGFAPILFSETDDDGSPKTRILTMTKTMRDQFVESADAFNNDILGRLIRLKRVGKEMHNTRYTVLFTGKQAKELPDVEVPDHDKAIGPHDRDSIVGVYHKAGIQVPGEAEFVAESTWVASDDVPDDDSESPWGDI